MKKVIVMTLICSMCLMFVMGCNGDTSMVEDGQSTEGTSVATSDEVVSEETSDSDAVEPEMSEEVSEMTLEEKILAEMPAKLEVGEDEIIVPETVTAEQIMGRYEEIKVSDVEYAEDINKEDLAGLLVLNCSYMEPAEFEALVKEHFGNVDELLYHFSNYRNYLGDSDGIYGKGTSVLPEELFFDEHLINQAEQLHYLFDMYQTNVEKFKEYYDIIVDYVYRDNNKFLTFDCNDERLEGSGLVALQCITAGVIVDDLIVYDTDLFTAGAGAETINNTNAIVKEHYNK